MHIFWGRVLVNATRSMNRELNQNCYLTFLMFSYIKNGSRLPDARSTRSGRENCLLTLSGCDKVRRSRFHLVAATYRRYLVRPTLTGMKSDCRRCSSICSLPREQRTFRQRPAAPIGKSPSSFSNELLFHLPRPPPLSTYSFRQVVGI